MDDLADSSDRKSWSGPVRKQLDQVVEVCVAQHDLPPSVGPVTFECFALTGARQSAREYESSDSVTLEPAQPKPHVGVIEIRQWYADVGEAKVEHLQEGSLVASGLSGECIEVAVGQLGAPSQAVP